MIKHPLSLEIGDHLYYCQRFSRVMLYGGADRISSILLAECYRKIHGKNIELILTYNGNEKSLLLNSHQERKGIAKLLTPPFYEGKYCTEGNFATEYTIIVRSLDLPYINAHSNDNDDVYITDKDSQKNSLGYVVNSKRFGTMINLLCDNSFSIHEIIHSCFGLKKTTLGVWEFIASDNSENEHYLARIFDVVLILIFVHILVLPLIISDISDGYS